MSTKAIPSTVAILCLVIFGLAQQGGAGPLEELVTQTVAAAGSGDVRAQTMLGVMHERGFGVGRDSAKALQWFKAAAARDDSTGHTLVGRAYADGRGVSRDESQAILSFHRGALAGLREFSQQPILFAGGPEGALSAAQEGNVFAQVLVGRMYLTGFGVEPNDAEAVRWLSAAAARGLSGTDQLLALMFHEGRGGLPTDTGEAMRRYRRAAQQIAEITEQSLTMACLGLTGRADCKTGSTTPRARKPTS